MRQKQKRKTIYAFIDSQNLNLGVLSQGWVLNFYKFYRYLSDQYHIKRAYLFIGYIHSNKKLYAYLKDCGYILIFKPTLDYNKYKKKKIKGNVDAELVLHAMINFNKFDKAIIVSGDGDFYCLVDYLHKKNKLLKIIIPNQKSYSILLKEFLNNAVFVTSLKEKLKRR